MLSRRGFLTAGGSVATLGALAAYTWPDIDRYTEAVSRMREALAAEPALADLIRYATLAANGHNTQPWRFRVSADTITIHPDFSRRTAVVDPDDHHLYVSLGCTAENLLIAGRAHGRPGAADVRSGPETTIEIVLGTGAPDATPLYSAIPFRQSTRAAFDGQPVSSGDLAALEAAAREDGVSVQLLTDPQQREAVLDFVIAANSAQMNDPAFVAELRDWIRFSPQQALATNDGLFGACSGNPAVPEWLGTAMFGLMFREGSENDKYRAHIRSSAGIAVFTGDREDPAHWIKVGHSFERFALQATALGIRTAHINQPVEVPAIRPEFSRWLGLGAQRPDLVVRFGRAAPLPMSVRRPVTDLLLS